LLAVVLALVVAYYFTAGKKQSGASSSSAVGQCARHDSSTSPTQQRARTEKGSGHKQEMWSGSLAGNGLRIVRTLSLLLNRSHCCLSLSLPLCVGAFRVQR
jgi:hypothetical protein